MTGRQQTGMNAELRLAMVGLDTSHAVEFTRRLQAPDCPPDLRVAGARVVSCVRFVTPFQDAAGLDLRQAQLEAWGVAVGTDLDATLMDVDAILIAINDPALHLEYVRRCAGLKKPIFLDKPLAANLAAGREIAAVAADQGVPLCSASSLRFVPALQRACEQVPSPRSAVTWGALGRAPAGSSIVWYGVHGVEMLQRGLGRGACVVSAHPVSAGAVLVVEYASGATGVVELYEGGGYGGVLRAAPGTDAPPALPFVVDMRTGYSDLLRAVVPFLAGGPAPVALADTLEVMAILEAADRACRSGRAEPTFT